MPAALAFVVLSSNAQAHGVVAHTVEGGVGVRVEYDSGHPVAHAEARIFAPEMPEEPYQSGFTDVKGFFMFFPSKPGEWRIEIDDGMGHRAVKSILMDEESVLQDAVTVPSRNRWKETVMGLLVIIALFSILAFWMSRTRINEKA